MHARARHAHTLTLGAALVLSANRSSGAGTTRASRLSRHAWGNDCDAPPVDVLTVRDRWGSEGAGSGVGWRVGPSGPLRGAAVSVEGGGEGGGRGGGIGELREGCTV